MEFHVGCLCVLVLFLGALLDEVAMERTALACHFSLDLLCDKTSSLSTSL